MTAATAPYQPHDGEVGHLTTRATYREARGTASAYYAIEAPVIDRNGATAWLAVEEWFGCIVSFRPLPPPPLPTVPGSMILAHVSGTDRPDLLVLRPVTDHESGEVTRWPAGSMVWESHSNGWIDPLGIAPGWVQIDPATLQPVAVTA